MPKGWSAHNQTMYTCENCGKQIKGGGIGTHRKWCSKREAHFWSKIDKTSSARGCWLYTGTISFEGYGYVNLGSGKGRKQWQAHRFAWHLLKRDLPAGRLLLHHCDVRNCVNPEHLYLGDRSDNARDMMARGRHHHRYSPLDQLHWPQLSRRKP